MLSVLRRKSAECALGRSPGSEVKNLAASPSPVRRAPSGLTKRRALSHSGGTAPDLHRLPCYARHGHQRRSDTNTKRAAAPRLSCARADVQTAQGRLPGKSLRGELSGDYPFNTRQKAGRRRPLPSGGTPRSCRLSTRMPFGMEPRHLASRCGRCSRVAAVLKSWGKAARQHTSPDCPL
jgi:hypothetical protein